MCWAGRKNLSNFYAWLKAETCFPPLLLTALTNQKLAVLEWRFPWKHIYLVSLSECSQVKRTPNWLKQGTECDLLSRCLIWEKTFDNFANRNSCLPAYSGAKQFGCPLNIRVISSWFWWELGFSSLSLQIRLLFMVRDYSYKGSESKRQNR